MPSRSIFFINGNKRQKKLAIDSIMAPHALECLPYAFAIENGRWFLDGHARKSITYVDGKQVVVVQVV